MDGREFYRLCSLRAAGLAYHSRASGVEHWLNRLQLDEVKKCGFPRFFLRSLKIFYIIYIENKGKEINQPWRVMNTMNLLYRCKLSKTIAHNKIIATIVRLRIQAYAKLLKLGTLQKWLKHNKFISLSDNSQTTEISPL